MHTQAWSRNIDQHPHLPEGSAEFPHSDPRAQPSTSDWDIRFDYVDLSAVP